MAVRRAVATKNLHAPRPTCPNSKFTSLRNPYMVPRPSWFIGNARIDYMRVLGSNPSLGVVELVISKNGIEHAGPCRLEHRLCV